MPDLKYMVIAGATGVGKTDLAFEVAQALQTEIVGADAFQIYRGLDILTGKPTISQLRALRHHLIGVIPLTEAFDAHRYALLACQTILDLNQNGTVPLVVGGTGFYLQALEQPLAEIPLPDPSLRSELESWAIPTLLKELAIRDPIALARIDQKNKRRIIRALEVCIISGKPFSSFASDSFLDPAIPRLFLERPRKELIERINWRVARMFAEGLVAEVAAVERIGPTASQAIGFSHIRSLLAGAIDESTCRDFICLETRQYAKRQIKWFRRQPYEFVSAESATERLIARFRERFRNSR
jgi:tRNA dimethylallyltransferase